jgi:hypothetical protein
MLPQVHKDFVDGSWFAPPGEPPARTKERKATMRLVLARYVTGAQLNINRDIKELGSARSNVAMRGFWEFRSHPPQEETRLFGFFARTGAFVATDFQPRGKFTSQALWNAQKASCQSRWDSLTNRARVAMVPWPVTTRDHLNTYLGHKA